MQASKMFHPFRHYVRTLNNAHDKKRQTENEWRNVASGKRRKRKRNGFTSVKIDNKQNLAKRGTKKSSNGPKKDFFTFLINPYFAKGISLL